MRPTTRKKVEVGCFPPGHRSEPSAPLVTATRRLAQLRWQKGGIGHQMRTGKIALLAAGLPPDFFRKKEPRFRYVRRIRKRSNLSQIYASTTKFGPTS